MTHHTMSHRHHAEPRSGLEERTQGLHLLEALQGEVRQDLGPSERAARPRMCACAHAHTPTLSPYMCMDIGYEVCAHRRIRPSWAWARPVQFVLEEEFWKSRGAT